MSYREISEEDKKEYDLLEYRPLSLQEFSRERQIEEVKNGKAKASYNEHVKLHNGRTDEFFKALEIMKKEKPATAVQRTIIIDGANIMHCGSQYSDTRTGSKHKNIPDVAALLSVMRFFVARDFEVFVVISRKYENCDVTSYGEAIAELIRNKMCVTVPDTNLDDTIALEYALRTNGIVISSDKFRDHATRVGRFRRLVSENRLGLEWVNISSREFHQRSRNQEEDYTACKRFFFEREGASLSNASDLMRCLYVSPSDVQYEMTKERFEEVRPDKSRERRLRLLNNLIVKGLQECERNVNRIREMPVYRREARVTSQPQPHIQNEEFVENYQNDYEEW